LISAEVGCQQFLRAWTEVGLPVHFTENPKYRALMATSIISIITNTTSMGTMVTNERGRKGGIERSIGRANKSMVI